MLGGSTWPSISLVIPASARVSSNKPQYCSGLSKARRTGPARARVPQHKMKRLIWQLTGRGFLSEINVMVMARLFCLDRGIEFCLDSRHWNAAYQKGWEDYFQPFCEETTSGHINFVPPFRITDHQLRRNIDWRLLFSSESWRSRVARAKSKALLSFEARRPILLNHDVFPKIWNPKFVRETF